MTNEEYGLLRDALEAQGAAIEKARREEMKRERKERRDFRREDDDE